MKILPSLTRLVRTDQERIEDLRDFLRSCQTVPAYGLAPLRPSQIGQKLQHISTETVGSWGGHVMLISSLDDSILDKIRNFASGATTVFYVRDARLLAASGEASVPMVHHLNRLGEIYRDKLLFGLSLKQVPSIFEQIEKKFAGWHCRGASQIIIHIEGGQTFQLEEILNNDLGSSIRETLWTLLARGARLVGQSAGAITLGSFNTAYLKRYNGDLCSWNRSILEGHASPNPTGARMAEAVDASFIPHFITADHGEKAQQFANEKKMCVFGIEDGGFLMFKYVVRDPHSSSYWSYLSNLNPVRYATDKIHVFRPR